MPKFFTRIVALLLLPCLVADPVKALAEIQSPSLSADQNASLISAHEQRFLAAAISAPLTGMQQAQPLNPKARCDVIQQTPVLDRSADTFPLIFVWNKFLRLIRQNPQKNSLVLTRMLVVAPLLEQYGFRWVVQHVHYLTFNPFLTNLQPLFWLSVAIGGFVFGFILHGDRFFERDPSSGKILFGWSHFHFWKGLMAVVPMSLLGAMSLWRWSVAGTWGLPVMIGIQALFNWASEGEPYSKNFLVRFRTASKPLLSPLETAIKRHPFRLIVGGLMGVIVMARLGTHLLWMPGLWLGVILFGLAMGWILGNEVLENPFRKTLQRPVRNTIGFLAWLVCSTSLFASLIIFTQQGWRTPWTQVGLSPAARQIYDRYHILVRGADDAELKTISHELSILPNSYQEPGMILMVPNGISSALHFAGFYSPFVHLILLSSDSFLDATLVHELAHRYQDQHLPFSTSLKLSRAHERDRPHFDLISSYARSERVNAVDPDAATQLLHGVEAFAETEMLWVIWPEKLFGIEQFDQSPDVQFFVETAANAFTEYGHGHWFLRLYATTAMQKAYPGRYPLGYVLVPIDHPHLTFQELVALEEKTFPAPSVNVPNTTALKWASYLYNRPIRSIGDLPEWNIDARLATTRRPWASQWETYRQSLQPKISSEHAYVLGGALPAWNLIRSDLRTSFLALIPSAERARPEFKLFFDSEYFADSQGTPYYETALIHEYRLFFENAFRQAGIANIMRRGYSDADLATDAVVQQSRPIFDPARRDIFKAVQFLSVYDRRLNGDRLFENFDAFFAAGHLSGKQSVENRKGILIFDQDQLDRLGSGPALYYFALRHMTEFVSIEGGASTDEAFAAIGTVDHYGLSGLDQALQQFSIGHARPARDWFLGGLASVEHFKTNAEQLKAGKALIDQDRTLSPEDRARAQGLWQAGIAFGARRGRIVNVVQYLSTWGLGTDPEQVYTPNQEDLNKNPEESARFGEAKNQAEKWITPSDWPALITSPRHGRAAGAWAKNLIYIKWFAWLETVLVGVVSLGVVQFSSVEDLPMRFALAALTAGLGFWLPHRLGHREMFHDRRIKLLAVEHAIVFGLAAVLGWNPISFVIIGILILQHIVINLRFFRTSQPVRDNPSDSKSLEELNHARHELAVGIEGIETLMPIGRSLNALVLGVPDSYLLRPIASLLIANHPALSRAKTLLAYYVDARHDLALALRRHHLDDAERAFSRMRSIFHSMAEVLEGFPSDSSMTDLWNNEFENAGHAVEFLEKNAALLQADSMRELAIDDIARRLESPFIQIDDDILLERAGIRIERLQNVWWPELGEALRLQHLMSALHQRNNLDDRSRRWIIADYLLDRVENGRLDAASAQEWLAHPPTFNTEDAYEMVESLRTIAPFAVSPSPAEAPANTIEEKANRWLGAHWKMTGMAALVAVLIGSAIIDWKMPHQSVPPAIQSQTAADASNAVATTGNTPSIFGGADFAERLKKAQEVPPEDKAKAAALTQEQRSVQTELDRIAKDEQQAQQKLEVQQQKIAQLQTAVQEAQREVERTKAAARTPEDQKAQQAFDGIAQNLQEGNKTDKNNPEQPSFVDDAMALFYDLLPRRSVPGKGLFGPQDRVHPDTDTLGQRQTVMRFAKPFTSEVFIREGTFENFDMRNGEWTRPRPAPSDLLPLANVNSVISNSEVTHISRAFTALAVPEGTSPQANSFRFSVPHLSYSVYEDDYGQSYLLIHGRLPPAGADVRFDLTVSNNRWQNTAPKREASTSMESLKLKTDTQIAVGQARQQMSFETQVNFLINYVHERAEYTLSDALDRRHRALSGHFVFGLDAITETFNGVSYRLLDCDTADTYAAALIRQLGYAVRLVTGYAASPGTSEVSSWQAHAVIEVFNPATRTWVSFDATPPDRFANGDERKYRDPEPVMQPPSEAERMAQRRYDERSQELERARQPLSNATQAVSELQQRRRDAESHLQKVIAQRNERVEERQALMRELTDQLATTAGTIQDQAKRDPAALLSQLLDPARGIQALQHQLSASNIPLEIQIRYATAVAEMATEALQANNVTADQLRPLQLLHASLLSTWLSNGSTTRPLVVYETWAQQPLQTRIWKPEFRPGGLRLLDDRYSFPMTSSNNAPADVKSNIRILQSRSPDVSEAFRWIQDADGTIQGFSTSHQVFSRNAAAAFLPSTLADKINRLVSSPQGGFYALAVQNTSNSSTFNVSEITDIVTGQQWHPGPPSEQVQDLVFDVEGNGYCLTRQPGTAPAIFDLGTHRFIPRNYYGNGYLARIDGKAYFYVRDQNEMKGQLYDIREQKTVSVVQSIADRYTQNNNNAYVVIVSNPKSGAGYWIDFADRNRGIYDMKTGQMISPMNAISFTQPIFDEKGNGFYTAVVVRNGQQGNYLFRLGQTDPIQPAGIRNLLGVSQGRFFWQALDSTTENQLRLIIDDANPSSIFSYRMTLNASLYESPAFADGTFYSRVFQAGRWRIVAVQPDSERVISSSEAQDVTVPFAAEGRLIFAEKIGGEWRWRTSGQPLIDNVRIKYVGADKQNSNIVIQANVAGHQQLFEYRSSQLTRLNLINHPVIDSYAGPKGAFYTTASAYSGQDTIYKAGEDQPLLPKDWQLRAVHMGADGIFYYVAFGPNPYPLQGYFNSENRKGFKVDNSLKPDRFLEAPDHTLYLEGITGNNSYEVWDMKAKRFGKTSDVNGSSDGAFGMDGKAYVDVQKNKKNVIVQLPDDRVVFTKSGRGIESDYLFAGQDNAVYLRAMFGDPMHPSAGFSGGTIFRLNDGKQLINSPMFDDFRWIRTSRDGSLFYGATWDHERHTRLVGRLPDDSHQDAQSSVLTDMDLLPNSNTGILWMPGDNGLNPYFLSSTGKPDLLSQHVSRTTEAVGDRSRRLLQGGPPGSTAVIYIAGDNNAALLALDPDQELDRILNWAVKTQKENPALAASNEWRSFRSALISRINSTTGPFMPALRRMQLYLLTAGTAEQTAFNRSLKELNDMPGLQQEARTVWANRLHETFEHYRQVHGSLPFNPAGVKDAGFISKFLNDELRKLLSRPQPWRLTKNSADETALLSFNDEITKVVSDKPWLLVEVKDLKGVWLSDGDLFIRAAQEIAHQPIDWFLGLQFLAALMGLYVEFKQAKSREYFNKLIAAWANDMRQHVFLIDRTQDFSLEQTSKQLPVAQQRQLKPYIKTYRSAPGAIQSAVWNILTTDGLIPKSRSLLARIFEPFPFLLPVLWRAYQERRTETAWKNITAMGQAHPLVDDTVHLKQFLDGMLALKQKLKALLPNSYQSSTPRIRALSVKSA